MSFETLEQLNPHAEARDESQKRFKISYARDFLLSLSQLEVCKKLPRGFDASILSEYEGGFRSSGGLSSQNYRRNDYSSSPPTKGDGNSYLRGIHGRWDSRSSGRSDRDSDSQSDLDSDSARHGNQSRRSWQVPEHDGLLGSGSFPRPPGHVTGTSGPKSRTNDQYQLNRSNEPYHPPRPYKAAPHLRRDNRDSYNDETFGSSENTSEDRAEEERKRRASFELMRKEQHKSFQEKQKNPEKSKDHFDFSELLEDPKDDKRFPNRRNESDEKVLQPTSNSDSDKSSFPSAAHASRPLVPPGFSSPIVEKNIGNKPLIHPQPSEIGNEPDSSLFHAKGNWLSDGDFDNQEEKQSLEEINSGGKLLGGSSVLFSDDKQSEKIQNFPLAVNISEKVNQSKVLESLEATQSSEILEHNAKDFLGGRTVGEPTPTHSTSILDKLFGSTLTLNGVGPSSIIEKNVVKADDALTPHMVQSSKFAQWFLEEEKKPHDDPKKLVENFSYDRPNEPVDEPSFCWTTKSGDEISSEKSTDLLSLIVGGEKRGSLSFDGENNISLIGGGENGKLLTDDAKKSGSQVFDGKVTKNYPPSFPLQLAGIADGHVAPKSVLRTVDSIDKIEAVPAVLTCEDLEQSILSEITENAPVLPSPMESWNGLVVDTEQKKADIDNHASQHLLSLLQKGEPSTTDLRISSSVRLQNIEKENLGTTSHDSGGGKPLTLETLFGTAFMKELKSAGAPTSARRGLSESERVDVSESSFPAMENILGSTADIPSRRNGLLASNQRAQVAPESIGERILGFDIRSKEGDTEFRYKLDGFDGIRLPEEDTLIAANDPLNLHNLAKEPLFESEKVDITDKLAALKSVYQDERTKMGPQEGQAIFHGSFGTRESDFQYHKLHGQSSSPQLHPSQLNHTGPNFHPLDSHPAYNNTQMKFMASENIIHHDPLNHQFSANLLRPPFHHPTHGLDLNPHNPVQQHMHGNFPPHLLEGFPRGSPHPDNHVTGFMPEPNLMQGFPFCQKQPYFGGPGVPPQGSGAPHPETLQRLIEMELRTNGKQRHPFPHNQGVQHGHELDMGFGFR